MPDHGLSSFAKVASVGVGTALLCLSLPYLSNLTRSQGLISFVTDFPIPDFPFPFPLTFEPKPMPFICKPSSYRTEIISLDPLVIYIHNFISPTEIEALLDIAEPEFRPSKVYKYGRDDGTNDRTSSSAGLPRDQPAVLCIMGKAREFMGTMIRDGWDDIGAPQLVRYTAGQKFNTHHDWYDSPQWANDGSRRTWNRIASFFAILQDNCTDGETHFPYLKPVALYKGQKDGNTDMQKDREDRVWHTRDPIWRHHEKGGLSFRPIKGNALFWINLHANGTGNTRTLHAGLPVGEGLKTAMNIWPKQYYGPY